MHLRYSFSLVLINFILIILLWATVIDILLAATCFIDPLTASADRHRLLAAFAVCMQEMALYIQEFRFKLLVFFLVNLSELCSSVQHLTQ